MTCDMPHEMRRHDGEQDFSPSSGDGITNSPFGPERNFAGN